MTKRERGSVGEGVHNWRNSELPPITKLGLVFKNNFRKLRTLKDCCGNHGDPGC